MTSPIAVSEGARTTLLLKEKSGDGDVGVDVVEESEDATSEDPDRAILCAQCSHELTTLRTKVARSGKHEHVFVNPHGIMFHVGCFSEAPGCTEIGEPSDEWTWFPGYHWQVSVCRECTNHVGWSYWADEDGFYGLILSRITEG